MAKKTTSKTNEKSFTFDDLKSELKKLSTLGSTLDSNDFATIKYNIDSGNYALNAVISGSLLKGYPGGRIVELAGEKQTGKTYCLLNAAGQAQKDGMAVVWYDTENALDKAAISPDFEINLSDIWYEPMNIIEKITKHLMQFLNTLIDKKRAGFQVTRPLIIIDSLGNLCSNKEFEDAQKDDIKVDMTRAKALSSFFRLIAIPLNEIEGTLIYSNHVYADTSSFVGGNKGKGGKGREYIASVLVDFYKSGGKDDGITKNGVIVRAKTNQKNRFAIPGEMQFHINYNKGMNSYIGLPFFGLPFKQDWFINLEKEGWDICGIQEGKIITQEEFDELARRKGDKFPKEMAAIDETQFKLDNNNLYFIDRSQVKKTDFCKLGDLGYAIKHLGTTVGLKDFYTPEVFTLDVLKMLDDKIIKPRFAFGDTEEFNSHSILQELAEEKAESEEFEELAEDLGL